MKALGDLLSNLSSSDMPSSGYNPARVMLDPSDPDYLKKLGLIHAAEGEHELVQDQRSSQAAQSQAPAMPTTPRQHAPGVLGAISGPSDSSAKAPTMPSTSDPDYSKQSLDAPAMMAAPSMAGLPAKLRTPQEIRQDRAQAGPPTMATTMAEKPAISTLMDKARGIQNKPLRILSEIGTGALTGGEALGESMFPTVAAGIPGSMIHTGREKAQAYDRDIQQQELAQKGAQTQADLIRAQAAMVKSPEEQTFANLLTQNNPATGQKYTPQEAFAEVKQAGEKAGEPKFFNIPGSSTPIQAFPKGGQFYTSDGTVLPQGAVPYEKPVPGQQPLSNDDVISYNKRIDNTLKGMGVDPADYHVSAKTTQTEAEKSLSDARGQATQERANRPAQRAADQYASKQAEDSVYAYDPQTKETVLTTPSEAKEKGYTNARKASESEISKDRLTGADLNDVQLNVSRYRQALDKQGQLSDADREAESEAINQGGLKVGAFGAELPTDWLNKLYSSSAFNNLRPAQRDAVVAYYRAQEAIPAYQRILTNSGRSQQEAMRIALQSIPTPIMDQGTANSFLGGFQENIDQVGQGVPRLPGMDSPKEVRSRVEGSGRNQSETQSKAPKASDVVKSGTFNGKKVFQLKNGDVVDASGNKVQ